MHQELWQHKIAYALLLVGLVVATVLFFAVWPNHVLQRIIILGVSVYYVLWGVVTHLHSARISRKVVLEYAAVAALGGTMLFVITL